MILFNFLFKKLPFPSYINFTASRNLIKIISPPPHLLLRSSIYPPNPTKITVKKYMIGKCLNNPFIYLKTITKNILLVELYTLTLFI